METVQRFLSSHGMHLLRDSLLVLGLLYLLLAVWLVWCYWRGERREDHLDRTGCYRVSEVIAEAEQQMKTNSGR